MPYISPQEREALTTQQSIATPGQLNYLLTSILVAYVGEHGLSYSTINEAMGALTCAQQEFYRRVAVNYETSKAQTNGDVYSGLGL